MTLLAALARADEMQLEHLLRGIREAWDDPSVVNLSRVLAAQMQRTHSA